MKKSEKLPKIFFFFAVVLFWFSQYAFIPHFTPYLTENLAIPAATAGLIVGAYGLLQTCLRLPVGIFGSKSSVSRFSMVLGAAALSVSSVLLLLAHTVSFLWLARALAGVSAATWVCFTVFFSETFASGDKRAMGYMVSANNLGMMLGYIAAALFNDRFGISFLFALSGISAGIAALLLFLIFKHIPKLPHSAGVSLAGMSIVLRSRRLWSCSFFTALSQLVSFATMISFSANYAVSIGCSGTQIGMISVVNTVAGFLAASLIASGMLERIKPKRLVTTGFLLMFIYCMFLPKCTDIAGLLALQFLGGVGRNFIMTTMMAGAVSDIPSGQKTLAMGIFQSIYGLGMTLGPILMGWLLGVAHDYSSAFSIIAMVCIAGALLSLIKMKDRNTTLH